MLIVELTDAKLRVVIKEYFTLDSATTNENEASKEIAEYLKPNWYEHCAEYTAQLTKERQDLADRIKPMLKINS